jgi:hypothetical protein
VLPEEEVGAEGGEEDDQDGRLPEHVEVEAEDEVGAKTEQDREQHELRQEEHLHCSPTETLHSQTENSTFEACLGGRRVEVGACTSTSIFYRGRTSTILHVHINLTLDSVTQLHAVLN